MQILSSLMRREGVDGNVDFRTALSQHAAIVGDIPAVDADRFADENLTRYWNWFLKEMDVLSSRGIAPYFEKLPGNIKAFAHFSHQLGRSADPVDIERGRLLAARPLFLKAIDDLTDRQYEALACVTCEAIGAINTHLTPAGNEGGIDFVATLRLGAATHLFSSAGTEFRVIGQCKKYTAPVSVDRMEQFLQTMNNVRYRSERVRQHLPVWFEEAGGPIFGWVISHSGFQSGAMNEAKKHGVLISDTVDIAELISQAHSFFNADPPAVRAQQIPVQCQRLLQ